MIATLTVISRELGYRPAITIHSSHKPGREVQRGG